ncbi:hypothetical protein [Faecalibacterium langellae]|nr:hypothetical protein [Faecalibacterium prausnitzii]
MPRMSKKRRLEWSFFLRQVKVGNTTCDRITYNDLCRGCTHSCKQSFRAVIILCPRYYSKRRKKEDRAKLPASGNVHGNDFPTERCPLHRYQ